MGIRRIAEPDWPQIEYWSARQSYQGSIYRFGIQDGEEEVPSTVVRYIGCVLESMDFAPTDRMEHFQCYVAPGVAIIGWYGRIEHTETLPGGYYVTIRVHPKLEQVSSVETLTIDHRIERYYFDRNGTVAYLGSDSGPAALRGSVFGS